MAKRSAVLVHGDVHQWNALEAKQGFKLVDPDGLLAEAEYDLGILMREDPTELLDGDPRRRAHWLAARCGLDAAAIWEWESSSESRLACSAPRSSCNRWPAKCSPARTRRVVGRLARHSRSGGRSVDIRSPTGEQITVHIQS